MVAINIQSLADTATTLIAENGRDAVLRSQETTGPAWEPVITDYDLPINVFQSAFDAFDREFFTVQSNDIKFLVSSEFDVTLQKKIVDQGIEYTVVNVRKIQPGNINALYIVQART